MADTSLPMPAMGHVELIETGRSPILAVRMAQRLVRSDTVIAFAFLCAVIFLAFYEIIVGGKTMVSGNAAGVMGGAPPYGYGKAVPADHYRLDQGASAWVHEPLLYKVRDQYRDLKLPLWNSNYGGGGPFIAGGMTPAMNLIEAPVFIFGSPLSWDFYLVGRFLLTGFFLYLFARALGLGNPGSLVASVGFMFNGMFMMYTNNNYLDVYLYLPLLLFAIEKTIQTMKPRYVLLQAGATMLVLVGGVPEGSFIALLLAGFYSVYRLGSATYEERSRQRLLGRLAFITSGFAAGLMLAAPS